MSELDKQLEDLDQIPDGDEAELRKVRKVLGLINRVRSAHSSADRDTSMQETALKQATTREHSCSSSSDPLTKQDVSGDKPTAPYKIDRFVIKRQLGQGGYGLVFLASDPQLDRDVALKVPRPEVIVTPSLRSRFLREAKAAASLSHPNIVPVFESGGDGPICFITYEFINGITLAQWLSSSDDSHRPDQRDSARLVATLADSVQHAHQRGVLHRDLKPANIMLKRRIANQTAADEHSETPEADLSELGSSPPPLASMIPLITDFGMAKLIGTSDLIDQTGSNQTRTGAIIGTPAYMSPEQTQASTSHVDARSDVYSLGAILYELLTNRPPFLDDTVLGTLQRVQKSEPTSPHRLNPTVSSDLAAICLKCLEKAPADRYESAYELQTDLQRFLERRGVIARPASSLNKVKKWYQRNTLLASSMTTATVAIVLGLISVTVLWLRADSLRSQAESRGVALAQRQRELQAKTVQLQTKTEQLNSAIRNLFLEVAKSDEIKSPAAANLRQGILERANQFYALFVAEQPDDFTLRAGHGQTLYELARVHEYLGDPEGALRLIREAIRDLAIDSGNLADQLTLITWHKYAATRLNQLGRFGEAKKEAAKAMEIANAAPFDMTNPHDDLPQWERVRASLLTKQAELRIADKEPSAALALAKQAMQIFENLNISLAAGSAADDLFDQALCYWIQGRAFGELGQLDQSIACLKEAVEILRHVAQTDVHINYNVQLKLGQCLYEKGVCHSKTREPDSARTCYQQALERYDALPDTLDLQLIKEEEYHQVAYSLAVADMLSRDFEQAETTILSCIETIEDIVNRVPQERVTLLDSLGDSYNLLYVIRVRSPERTLEDAEQAIRKAVDYYELAVAERPQWLEPQMALVQSQTNLGNVLQRQGKIEDALLQYNVAEVQLTVLLDSRPDWSKARQGMCNLLQGKMDAWIKISEFQNALPVCRQAQTFLSPNALNHILLQESWILANLELLDDARDCLERFAGNHARQSRDYIAAARKAIEIKKLVQDPTTATDFRDVAASLLKLGLSRETQSRRQFLTDVGNDEMVAELVAEIDDPK